MKQKIFFFLFSGLCMPVLLCGQSFFCDFIDDPVLRAASINEPDWGTYSGYDYNATSVKTVRLTFHIIQKSNGLDNYPNTLATQRLLRDTVLHEINWELRNNIPMSLEPELAPFQLDTRIRFELANIYFWQDNNDNVYKNSGSFYYNSKYYSFGAYLLEKYVVDKPDVAFKDNSIHVFFCKGVESGGLAALGGQWIVTSKLSEQHWGSAVRAIRHEMGHVMGLLHTWDGNDNCADTPLNPGCWDHIVCNGIYSNNTMDYNNCQCAFTQCQINRMHYYLNGQGYVNNCVVNSFSMDEPVLNVPNPFVCFGEPTTISIGNLPFGVPVQWNVSSTATNLNYTKTGNRLVINSSNINKSEGQIAGTLQYGNIGETTYKTTIWINGYNSQKNLSGNIEKDVGASTISTTNNVTTKIVSGKQVTFYHDNSVLLNAGFEIENGAEFLIINKTDECQ